MDRAHVVAIVASIISADRVAEGSDAAGFVLTAIGDAEQIVRASEEAEDASHGAHVWDLTEGDRGPDRWVCIRCRQLTFSSPHGIDHGECVRV